MGGAKPPPVFFAGTPMNWLVTLSSGTPVHRKIDSLSNVDSSVRLVCSARANAPKEVATTVFELAIWDTTDEASRWHISSTKVPERCFFCDTSAFASSQSSSSNVGSSDAGRSSLLIWTYSSILTSGWASFLPVLFTAANFSTRRLSRSSRALSLSKPATAALTLTDEGAICTPFGSCFFCKRNSRRYAISRSSDSNEFAMTSRSNSPADRCDFTRF
mmetsp:Transcript_4193/g.9578  ORF Transcript_4193/g.9578 Transcript_4193/m.9578 type:complete len:217 (-) Transcript_4193:115-765(-)